MGRTFAVAARVFLAFPLLLAFASPAPAQDADAAESQEQAPPPSPPQAKSLDELLKLVEQGWREQRVEDQERVRRFQREKADQEKVLAEAKATLARLEARSQQLEAEFQENETTLAELEASLSDRLGALGELFGVVRQVAGDMSGQVEGSLSSAQLDGRREFLKELGQSKALPSIAKLERLWYEMTREMTAQGDVVRFPANVLQLDGEEVREDVIRAGVFTAVANGEYLLWDPDIQRLRELARQPPSQFLQTVSGFEEATDGLAPLAVDPARGALLAVLIDTRSIIEFVPEGKQVGYAIIVLGVLAVLIALVRGVAVFWTARKVAAQQRREQPDRGNPLGRVMAVYEEHRDADPETLELKLDEAVMHESARLERFIWLVKVVSVVAPLMGLLGTVTGMINTFQAITLFGAGDPKMMAGGISEALVTTMLGLTVAIPLVLLHALLASSAKRVTDVLDEQSAGLIARRAEQSGA
jgi:biopolymer transport protein ExbB